MKVCSTLGRRESMKGRKLGLMQPIKAGQKQKFRNSNVSLQVPFFRNPGARLTMQHNLLQARGQDLQTRATTHMWRFLWIHEPTVVWFVPKPFTWIWSHTYSLQPIYPTHVFVTKLAILPWILPIQIVPSWIYACFNDYGGVIFYGENSTMRIANRNILVGCVKGPRLAPPPDVRFTCTRLHAMWRRQARGL